MLIPAFRQRQVRTIGAPGVQVVSASSRLRLAHGGGRTERSRVRELPGHCRSKQVRAQKCRRLAENLQYYSDDEESVQHNGY